MTHAGVCVGGPLDGKFIEVHSDVLVVPEKEDLDVFSENIWMSLEEDRVAFRQTKYHIEKIRLSDGQAVEFWRHESLLVVDSLWKLFDGYARRKRLLEENGKLRDESRQLYEMLHRQH